MIKSATDELMARVKQIGDAGVDVDAKIEALREELKQNAKPSVKSGSAVEKVR